MTDGERRGLWPWALGSVLAIAAVWLVLSVGERRGPPIPEDPAVERITPRDRGDPATATEPVAGAAAEEIVGRVEDMRASVRRYEEECSSRLEPAAGPGLGAVVGDCMDRLGGAIDAVVATDTVGAVAIDQRLNHYREQVERLRKTPPGEGRAEPTREVLRSAAEVLAVIAEERYPETVDGNDALRRLRASRTLWSRTVHWSGSRRGSSASSWLRAAS